MIISQKPYLIEFEKIGVEGLGFLSVAEKEKVPFEIKRVYWTYSIPNDLIRSAHAHYNLEQVVFAIAGTIIINTELLNGEKSEFVLDKPNIGLYLPKMCWRVIFYKPDSSLVSIASLEYDADDYMRDY